MALKKRLSCIGMTMPIKPERLRRKPLAWRLSVYFRSLASASTRMAVSSPMRRLFQVPFRIALTVDAEVSAMRARS
ncbi:hypothetical protein D3C87_1640590 [compost metagenome]